MANLGFTFDPTEVPADEGGDFPLIPAGTGATMQFEETSLVMKDGAGNVVDHMEDAVKARLNYKVKILDGQHENRVIFGGMNIVNPNPDAQRIAQQELAAAFIATGTPPSDESNDLLYKPFFGVLKVETDKSGQYEPKNTVNWRKSRPVGQQTAKAATPIQQRQAVPAQPAAQNKPWKTRAA
jgi:hypothetical protein